MSACEILRKNLEKANKAAKEALEAALNADYPYQLQQNTVKYNKALKLVRQIKATLDKVETYEGEDITAFLDKRKVEF